MKLLRIKSYQTLQPEGHEESAWDANNF